MSSSNKLGNNRFSVFSQPRLAKPIQRVTAPDAEKVISHVNFLNDKVDQMIAVRGASSHYSASDILAKCKAAIRQTIDTAQISSMSVS